MKAYAIYAEIRVPRKETQKFVRISQISVTINITTGDRIERVDMCRTFERRIRLFCEGDLITTSWKVVAFRGWMLSAQVSEVD
jgi:hypothetical protein